MEEIKNWLTCNLQRLSLTSLTDDFHSYDSDIMQSFLNCSKRDLSQYGHNSTIPPATQLCLRRAHEQCLASNIIILKLIRLRMRQAISLLPFFPNMKIVHLVRDPRAIVSSRQVVGLNNSIGFTEKDLIVELCSQIHIDLSDTKFLMRLNPKMIKLVQYEDLAEDPSKVTKDLYEFAGLKFDDKIERFVKNQTQANIDGCSFCTQRKNSTVASLRWRFRISFNDSQHIFNSCREIMSILGYVQFPDNETLRNVSIPCRRGHNVTATMMGDDRL
ncbi:hypothetical protein DPMN_046445 [Dreissena polymorpha]|uniref:Sulfotransferase n=1 Tax=Dreissena polymorpha TaxID=45954 RepID=A0A9D4D9K8_DREPO|nr:hypothetical protein DPMN_046445 [Dreissena polymorpha]